MAAAAAALALSFSVLVPGSSVAGDCVRARTERLASSVAGRGFSSPALLLRVAMPLSSFVLTLQVLGVCLHCGLPPDLTQALASFVLLPLPWDPACRVTPS